MAPNVYGYGCGCGSPQIYTPPPPPNCDNCIVAPTIRWGCDVGPIPGGTISFNIVDETNIKLPDGHTYTFELYDFDTSGINTATVSSVGAVQATFHNVFRKRKEYRLRYKIRQVGGKMSKTGEVYFCMRSRCSTCAGVCDELTADCITMPPFTVEAECGETKIVNVPNWNADNVIFQNQPICVSSITFNPGTKNLTIVVDSGAPGCNIGQNIPITVLGSRGSVTTQTVLNFKITDKSIGVLCGPGMIANKCTGVCEQIPIDLQAGNNADLQAG